MLTVICELAVTGKEMLVHFFNHLPQSNGYSKRKFARNRDLSNVMKFLRITGRCLLGNIARTLKHYFWCYYRFCFGVVFSRRYYFKICFSWKKECGILGEYFISNERVYSRIFEALSRNINNSHKNQRMKLNTYLQCIIRMNNKYVFAHQCLNFKNCCAL